MKKGFVFLFLLLAAISDAQDLSMYEKNFFSANKFALPYRILYPPNVSEKKYPLLVFLHGAYEKGNDNESQLDIGGRYFLREENRKNFPAIVVFPQCPGNDLWADFETTTDSSTGQVSNISFPFHRQPTIVTATLKKLIDSLMSTGMIDPARIYIGGLSQGGMGVLDMIARYPQTFAGAFSICGGGDVSTSKLFAGKVALWLFHGEKDDIIPPQFSQQFYNRLLKLNADVRYTGYPGVLHNSWTNAFAEKDLLPWLFSKAKNQ